MDAKGFCVPEIAHDRDFRKSVQHLDQRFETAHHALGEVSTIGASLQNELDQRFLAFGEPTDAGYCAARLCEHHQAVQHAKSIEGKRPWFDRLGPDRIFIRHQYRVARREICPDRYVHGYRGKPIRRFHFDLS